MNPSTPDSLPPSSLILMGPTAVGKSDLAVDLAERLSGEIISADAFQIYAGLEILSAAPPADLRVRVPHHLVAELPLTATLDVARYRALALPRCWDVARRGKIPIVCGGAGMYARALTHGLSSTPPADPELRSKLEKEPIDALAARLRKLDPDSAVDMNNPRRVIRALEVCLLTGQPFSSFRKEWDVSPQFRGAILSRSRALLEHRIAARTEAMFAAGVVDEVRTAGVIGPTAGQMLGLREIQALIAGRISLAECKVAMIQATRQYAKRQMTWFRRERGYSWIDLDAERDPIGAIERVATPR